MVIPSVIVTVPMNTFWRAMYSRSMLLVVSAVIKLALCFSVGEGLRLSPFPVPLFEDYLYAQFSVTNGVDRTLLSQYGPLDVPAQTQKRSKRQTLKLVGPSTVKTEDLVPESSDFSNSDSLDVASLPSVPRPAGRAPPSLV